MIASKAQSAGSGDIRVKGFDCHGKAGRKFDVLCSRRHGRQLVHYHGALGRAAPSAARGGFEVCARQVSGDCEVEPRLVVAGARAFVRVKRWLGWGGDKAIGIGRFRYVAGAGDPPDAGIKTRARVTYSQKKGCGGDPRYSHLQIKYGKALKKTWGDFDIFRACS